MLTYSENPARIIQDDGFVISSFIKEDEANIDWKTLHSFGQEWSKFNSFTDTEIAALAGDYFDIVSDSILNPDAVALDMGCGSGRWIKFVAPQVRYVEAIEPSRAVLSAARFLSSMPNVRLTQASVERIPFANNTFDFVYSLGVLHHVPDTQSGIRRCYEKIKPGGWFLLYLYYNLDNRSGPYKILFHGANLLRSMVCRLPDSPKRWLCDFIALTVYLPLSKLSLLFSFFSTSLADAIPLGYYRKTSFRIMRNDSLDRLGTPLERRFSRIEIEQMLANVGFTSIRFSQKPPYWHVVAQKK